MRWSLGHSAGPALWQVPPRSIRSWSPLAAADKDAGGEYQGATKCHLKCGGKWWGIHVFPADPTDHGQFNDHYGDRDRRRGPEVGDQVRQRVADSAERGHQTGDGAANIRRAAAGEAAVVGERLGEGHGNAGAER